MDLVHGRGLSLVYVTHNLDELEALGGQARVLLAGHTVEQVEDFRSLRQLRHPYSRLLALSQNRAVSQFRPVPIGCPFSAACPWTRDECAAEVPPVREVEPGHRARCVLY